MVLCKRVAAQVRSERKEVAELSGNGANPPRLKGDAKCTGRKASHWVGLGKQAIGRAGEASHWWGWGSEHGQMNSHKGSSGRFTAYPLL